MPLTSVRRNDMSASNHPIRTRALQAAVGIGALVVAFGIPATASAQEYPPVPPAGGDVGSQVPSGSGAQVPSNVAQSLPQTGSGIDATLALAGGALIAGFGMSALAWRRRPLAP